jgi:hypothetical protein
MFVHCADRSAFVADQFLPEVSVRLLYNANGGVS